MVTEGLEETVPKMRGVMVKRFGLGNGSTNNHKTLLRAYKLTSLLMPLVSTNTQIKIKKF